MQWGQTRHNRRTDDRTPTTNRIPFPNSPNHQHLRKNAGPKSFFRRPFSLRNTTKPTIQNSHPNLSSTYAISQIKWVQIENNRISITLLRLKTTNVVPLTSRGSDRRSSVTLIIMRRVISSDHSNSQRDKLITVRGIAIVIDRRFSIQKNHRCLSNFVWKTPEQNKDTTAAPTIAPPLQSLEFRFPIHPSTIIFQTLRGPNHSLETQLGDSR